MNLLNQEFYRITATHFNATRQQAWQGWLSIPEHLTTPLHVLDLGCGNGRFAVFLRENLQGDLMYTGIDSDADLLDYAGESMGNINHTLIKADLLNDPLPDKQYDLVVLFGVMHHIPGNVERAAFLQSVASHVNSGGLLIFACWRFLDADSLKKRIVPWPEDMEREDHDYLLDWRRGEHALRYCHYVDDDEHQRLIAATGMHEVRSYRADGRNGQLNQYSILQRLPG